MPWLWRWSLVMRIGDSERPSVAADSELGDCAFISHRPPGRQETPRRAWAVRAWHGASGFGVVVAGSRGIHAKRRGWEAARKSVRRIPPAARITCPLHRKIGRA